MNPQKRAEFLPESINTTDPFILPSAFRIQPNQVPSDILGDIRNLFGARSKPFVRKLITTWLTIGIAIFIAEYIGSWWSLAIAIPIVASRQALLGLLIHEQSHKLGLTKKWGNLLTNLFAGYPLLIMSVENYATIHLTHHRQYFSEIDPDAIRKSGTNWQIPMKWTRLVKLLLSDFLGLNTISLILGKNPSKNLEKQTVFTRIKPAPVWVRILFFLVAGSLIHSLGLWQIFLIYWIVPLLTVFQIYIRWGALTEHVYNTPGIAVQNNTPLIIPSLLDRILIPNLNFSYHAYHHWYPAISFSLLPKLHQIYVKNNWVDEHYVFRGNRAYLKFILSGLWPNS